MATGNVLLSDDWVPHVREPSFDNRSKLAGVVRKLSMNGNNIMAEIITRDQVLSVTSIEGMLSMVRNWTRPEWNTPDPMHPGLPPSQAVIASESVKRAGNALNLLYRISEKTNREEDWALVDEWAEVWIESMLRASACHLPILPQETLAALVTAAVDTSLGSWDAGKALTLWNQLGFRKDTISASAARWATSAPDTVARSVARHFMMKHYLFYMECAALSPSRTRRTARDWVSRTENFLSLLREAAAEEEISARTSA